MLLLIETVLAIAAVVLSLTVKDLGSSWFERVEAFFRRVAQRRKLAVLIVGLAAVVARVVVLPVLPVPMPRIGDEFSHLLLADTLLHRRLANPTPPMWVHFETFEVIMRPTYASVYPPMQGLILAAGRFLTGQAFVGVMLSIAIMCGAICWMLQGWMPAEWAFLGGIIAVMRFGVFTYWADGYMGGAPAAIGGALAMGALPRITQHFRSRDAVILGVGLSMLANSRPFEGFLLSVPIAVAFLYWLFRQRWRELKSAFARVVAPLLIVVVIAGLATGYYFWCVTGNPLRTPYQVVWETYGMMPKFIWQALRPEQDGALRHEALKEFYYAREFATYSSMHTVMGLLKQWTTSLIEDWLFYLGPILTIPMLASAATAPYGFGWKRLNPDTRFLCLTTTIVGAGIATQVFSHPHSAAPITCIIIALILLAMRFLRQQIYLGKPFGLTLTRAIPVLSFLMLTLRAAALPLHIPMTQTIVPWIYSTVRADIPSYSVEARLENMSGQHLVIVQYVPGSDDWTDWMGWVYNDADIDASKIVRAWDMGPEKNRELVEYFSGRHVWLVTAGENAALTPYVDQSSP